MSMDRFHPHRKFCWTVPESEFMHEEPSFPAQNRGCVHKEKAEVTVGLVINKEGGMGENDSTDPREIRTVEVSMVAGRETQ